MSNGNRFGPTLTVNGVLRRSREDGEETWKQRHTVDKAVDDTGRDWRGESTSPGTKGFW